MMGYNGEMMMRLVSVCGVGGYVGFCPVAVKHAKQQYSYILESQSSNTMPRMIFRCGEDYSYLMITVLSQSQPQQPEPPCLRREMFCLLFLFNGCFE